MKETNSILDRPSTTYCYADAFLSVCAWIKYNLIVLKSTKNVYWTFWNIF